MCEAPLSAGALAVGSVGKSGGGRVPSHSFGAFLESTSTTSGSKPELIEEKEVVMTDAKHALIKKANRRLSCHELRGREEVF